MPRYYPIAVSTTRGSNEPSSEQSTALPNGTNGPSGAYTVVPGYFEMGTAKTVAGVQVRPNWNTLAQTARQSTFFMHGWYRLGAQTISAGTWGLGMATLTNNTNSNAFYAVSIYVWRPSTSAVVGYIYDASTELGAEWRGDGTAESRLTTLSGNSVVAANGDTLIFEFWATNAQAAATSYVNRVFFDASTATADFSADAQTGLSSWIDSPVTLTAFDPNAPIGPQADVTATSAITVSSRQIGSIFTISQQQIGTFVRGVQSGSLL